MQRKFPDENAKLTLDEAAFQRLLGAAYVIQEHNESVQSQITDPSEFKAADLSEIAEAQNLIRARKLDLSAAAALVVERARKIARAQAAAVALNAASELTYIASTGEVAPAPRSTVPLDQCLSLECIRSNRPSSVSNLKNTQGLQAKFFLGRGVQSFVALPIRNGHEATGVLELYFTSAASTDPATLQACELLAGLLNGLAVSTATASTDKTPTPTQSTTPQTSSPSTIASTTVSSNKAASVPAEGAPTPPPPPTPVPIASSALDQLHAELDRMMEEEPNVLPHPAAVSAPRPSASTAAIERCAKCGCPFDAQEAFCGLCGHPRQPVNKQKEAMLSPATTPLELERNLRRMDLPQKEENLPAELKEIIARFPEEQIKPNPSSILISSSAAANPVENNKALAASLTQQLGGSQNQNEPLVRTEEKPASVAPIEGQAVEVRASKSSETQPAKTAGATPQWKSASETRAWLESVKIESAKRESTKAAIAIPAKHWLVEHRSNLYLAISALLLILVLFGVGIPASEQAKGHLGWFDSMLVSLGIAEAPTAPVYLGNANAKVWVDVHTALYYCSDADAYGKTRDGKFETQRQAQQDQFEPAFNHPCP